MIVTATEFKSNLGKYLDMVATQDVYITKNGKNIARLTSPASRVDADEDTIRKERLARQ